MKIVIPGGSGQIGALLCRAFSADGHEVIVLSRSPAKAKWKTISWDATTLGPWANEIDGADVVINLAGKSVNCRYTVENRRQIKESRVASTRVIGQAIAIAAKPPSLWLQSGTATIYSHRYDAPNDEATGILGGTEKDLPDTWNFSIDVAKSWEAACLEAKTPRTRKVLLRSAMVMSPDRNGVFDVLLGLVRHGLGGTNGDGRQYVSWIHDRDFISAVDWLIEHQEVNGPVNLAAPDPLPNVLFMRAIRRAWGTRVGLPSTKLMLEFGAIFLRTETELILKSRRVVPGRLLESGFYFMYPNWEEAAVDLCRRWREMHERKKAAEPYG
jgi:uncharacterized protein (TIGR01777 family)